MPHEWTALRETYKRHRREDENPHEVVLNGGIELKQIGDPDSEDSSAIWKVRINPGRYTAVHVEE